MPDRVVQDGWVLVQDGKISRVFASKPDVSNATEVETGAIIFPGLIDLHNHVPYGVFPRWHPTRLFCDRYEWRDKDADFNGRVKKPVDYLLGQNPLGKDFSCDMNTYGELRALAGGTTSILAARNLGCIRGLVRNLDYSSGFYDTSEPDSTHILNEVNINPTTDPATLAAVNSFLADSQSEMLIVHLSEGVDVASQEEFHWFQDQGFLTSKTVIVHGVALRPKEFRAMHNAGTSLVWSPRSNVELYGETANVPAALDAGVRVGLAPDWTITGSSNLLDELHYAAQWNADHFSGRLTDQQLVDMVTTTAAQIAGIDDEVGAVQEGLYADLLIIRGNREDPYRALIQAQAGDVQLVLIGGQPIYGAPAFMEMFWTAPELDQVNVDSQPKMVRLPQGRFSELASELQSVLASQGTSLAPLTESRSEGPGGSARTPEPHEGPCQ